MFDKAYLGLKAQGFKQAVVIKANGYDLSCVYRGPNDTKCAVGHLISDELARSIEGRSVETLRGSPEEALLKAELGITSQDDLCFLEDLQECHDSTAAYRLAKDLAEFAHKYALTVPE
jgi:hypothetical protein